MIPKEVIPMNPATYVKNWLDQQLKVNWNDVPAPLLNWLILESVKGKGLQPPLMSRRCPYCGDEKEFKYEV